MKKVGLVIAFLFLTVSVRAQDCDLIVADSENVISSMDAQEIGVKAKSLINEGADVRVRIIGRTANLDVSEKNFERSCVSWQSPDGGRKSTLIVLMVSPTDHKMGIYYGGAFSNALKDHFTRIKQDYMAPHFRDKDWVGGFIATEEQLAARIKASKDEALHPAINTTVNQATDLSGLWTVLMWGLLIIAGIGGLVMLSIWLDRKRKETAEVRQAQRNAVGAKAQAADLINSKKDHKFWERASQEFNRLSQSVSNDPYNDDLRAYEYNSIADQYQKIVDMLGGLPAPYPPYYRGKRHSSRRPRPTESDVAASSAASSTVISGFPVPVPIVEEPVIIEEHHHFRSDPDPEPSFSSSSSSSDDGGGSSSFGGDSGGGDSGGGSSDFGGGGDSGGGGSSDF